MPRILYRHIVAELLRVMVLTTSVLVAVIAFGAAIRPIMQNLLGAEDLLPFVVQASVPMLQFALPFAAAFAGTIVYSRLTAENEVLAMSVAGLSYRKVLMPAVVLGMVLLLGMGVLVDAFVPRFWTSMQRLLTRDVTRLFVAAVERGEALVIDRTQLYADAAEVLTMPPEDGGPSTRLSLAGVAAIELGSNGRPTTEFTAEFATVDVYRTDDNAYLKLVFRNATAYSEEDATLIYVPQAEPEAIDLGKGIRLKPKDLDLRGLLRVWNDVGSYHAVAEPRAAAIAALAAIDHWSCIEERLATDGTVRLVDASGRRSIEVRNARLAGEKLLPRSGDALELAELDRGAAGRRASLREVTLRRQADARSAEGAFELVASTDDVVTTGININGRWPPRIGGLLPAGCTARSRNDATVGDLAAEVRAMADRSPSGSATPDTVRGSSVVAAQSTAIASVATMEDAVRRVRCDIVARIVQRINQSLAAPLMLVLGAVLAVRLKGANPLQVYLLAFVPSIIDILLISGGEQMLKESTSVVGILVATSGNIGLATMSLIALRKVARN